MVNIFRHLSRSNLQILLRALRHESPRQILQNLGRLLRSLPPKTKFHSKNRETKLYKPSQVHAIQGPDTGPEVSLLIPSKNNHKLLKACIDSLAKTTYQNYEILILDNASDHPKTLAYLEKIKKQPKIRVLRIPNQGSDFSFSYINNEGARTANGEYLLFLNDDTEVISPNWLSQMMGYASSPGVGVVGAKLLYPNGTTQHVGVGVGMYAGRFEGFPIHLFESKKEDDPAYFSYTQEAVYVSAVTGACMLIARDLFEELGGFDEALFPLAFNDIDLCHRVTEMGKRIVCANDVSLIHKESKSRKGLSEFQETINYKRKYRGIEDPYYNPNLSTIVPFTLNPLGDLREKIESNARIRVAFVGKEKTPNLALKQGIAHLTQKENWHIDRFSWESYRQRGEDFDVFIFVDLPPGEMEDPFQTNSIPAIWILEELPEKKLPTALDSLYCILVPSKRMKGYVERMTHEVPVEVLKKGIRAKKELLFDKAQAKTQLGISPEKITLLHHHEGTGKREITLRDKLQQSFSDIEFITLPQGNISMDVAYQAADIFVRTAMHSAEMSYVLKAMHAGLPILSHADIGVEEYVWEGKNALLVPTGSAQAMASALKKMLGQFESFAKPSAQVIELNPTFDEMLKKLEKIIIKAHLSSRVSPSA